MYSYFRRTRISIIFLVSIIIYINPIFAQQPNASIDSLKDVCNHIEGIDKVDVLNNLAKLYMRISPDSNIVYANKALKLALIEEYDVGEANALKNLGLGYHYSYRQDTAILYFTRSLNKYILLNDTIGIFTITNGIGNIQSIIGNQNLALESFSTAESFANNKSNLSVVYNGIAVVHARSYNYEKALIYLQKSLIISKEQGQNFLIGATLRNIANIHTRMEDYDNSAKYSIEAIDVFKKLDNPSDLIMAQNQLGTVYINTQQYDKALSLFKESISLAKEFPDEEGMAGATLNTGNIYLSQNKYDSALVYLQKSMKLYEKINFEIHTSECRINISEAYYKTGKYDSAMENLDKALNIAVKNNSFLLYMNTYHMYSDIYDTLSNYKKAFEYFKLAQLYSDSLVSNENKQNISELEIKYQVEIKEAENALLQQNLKVERMESARQKDKIILYWYTLIGILISFTGLLVIFILYKKSTLQIRKIKLAQIKQLEDKNTISELKVKSTSAEINSKKNLLTQINESLLMQSQLSNELVESLKSQRKFATVEGKREITMTLSRIHDHMAEDSWRIFERNFVSLYPSFFANLKLEHPDLSKNDLRLLTFMSRGIKAKEISLVTFQSENSINVAKGRLRAKLNIETNEQMEKYCMGLLVIVDNQY